MKIKTFIITGANRGLGEAFVDVLMKRKDCFVISISRSITKKQQNYSLENFYFLEADLTDNILDEKLNIIKNIVKGKDVCFINNASIIEPILKIEDISIDALDQIISVNIKSTILITKYVLLHFNNFKLSFVNITSGAANRAISNWSLYCSSKAFIQMFFRVAESEYKQHRFFNIDPGVMDTKMQRSIRESDFPDVLNFQNLKKEEKLKSPKDVALEIINTIR
jgi:benzil reductase ((S)-benzoin forming)